MIVKIINLQHRVDRKTKISSSLSELNISHEFVGGILIPTNIIGGNTLGCCLAQYNAIVSHTENDDLLLLEDDSQIIKNSWSSFNEAEKPYDWGIILLGGEGFVPPTLINDKFHIVYRWMGNHAVLYRKETIEKIKNFNWTNSFMYKSAEDCLSLFAEQTQTKIYRYGREVFYSMDGFSDRLNKNFRERRYEN